MKKPSIVVCSLTIIVVMLVCAFGVTEAQTEDDEIIIDVGVILNFDTWVGRMTQSCISMALDDYYASHNFTRTARLVLHTRDSHGDIVGAASSAIDLMKNSQVQAILGPQSSSEVDFVADIGNKAKVPIISFSATSPSISSTKTPYFIRTAQNDSMQVKAIAATIEVFGWREVVPIYEDTEYGKDIIPYLTGAVQDINARVPYWTLLPPSFTNDQIHGELYKLMTMQTRVFVVHMRASLATRLFSIAKEIGMMDKGYVWIISGGLTDSVNASFVNSMQGVLGIKPYVPRSDKLANFSKTWRRKFIYDNPDIDEVELGVLGLWAYDSVWALANSVEKINPVSPRFNKSNTGNRTDLEALGTSQIGPKLLESLLQTKFNGLSGEFWLKDGQLQSSVFQIVNVIGNGGKQIGFWSPALGISAELGVKMSSISKKNLGAIIWPGDTTEVPKGWEVPTSEKRLKIGVPVKDGFSEFVKVNSTTITGFCIVLFKAVIDSLPYAVPYDFIPFEKEDGQSAGTYNELVDMVYFKKYDAAVGDITIQFNRSQNVDFTLPFSESGVSLVVPMKGDDSKNAWIFLKPLKMDLWLTTAGFFISTGFVVWVLEHQINKDFRGRPSEQVGTMFWFSFSTLVFAQKERVISKLARFVLIIWIFVVLILTSSYTANLTSMLTVQKLQPSITGIGDLTNEDFVGYQDGSFVVGLMESLGIDPSKFRSYGSVEECHEALSRGSKNGGISAFFDEIPYIKLFLTKYCTKYMMVGPTYKTAGFGFAFPKGSPLVPDISAAILNVTEGNTMVTIEKAWLGSQASCPEQGGSTINSDSLTLESFKGLFLIAGIASGVAFIMFLVNFLYEHKNILASEGSIPQKIAAIVKEFDKEKYSSSSESKKIDPSNGRTSVGRAHGATEYDISGPQSPTTSVFPHSPAASVFPQSPATSVSQRHELRVFPEEESFSCSGPSTPTPYPSAVSEIHSSN